MRGVTFDERLISTTSQSQLVIWGHPQIQKDISPLDRKVTRGHVTSKNDKITQLLQDLLSLNTTGWWLVVQSHQLKKHPFIKCPCEVKWEIKTDISPFTSDRKLITFLDFLLSYCFQINDSNKSISWVLPQKFQSTLLFLLFLQPSLPPCNQIP